MCDRTKDGDCRVADNGFVLCHTELNGVKKGERHPERPFIYCGQSDKAQGFGTWKPEHLCEKRPEKPKREPKTQYFDYCFWDGTPTPAQRYRKDFADGRDKEVKWCRGGLQGRPQTEVAPYFWHEMAPRVAEGELLFVAKGELKVQQLQAEGYPAISILGISETLVAKLRAFGALVVLTPDCDHKDLDGWYRELSDQLPEARTLMPPLKGMNWRNPPEDGGLGVEDWLQQSKPDAGAIQSAITSNPWKPVTKPQGGVEGDPALPPIDQWDEVLKGLVDPDHECFEKNSIRRQIRAATSARELGVSASPNHVRATLLQHQRNLITGTAEKGTKGGEKAKFKQKEYLINNLIAMRCLTGIAAFNKVGKTKVATDLVASLIYQIPFLGNPEWTPAPPPPEGHKFILWWVDQPGADSSNYLKARGLMDADGTLHPQIVSLYTEEDDLAWDDQGMDRLIQDTANNPGAILITDSFFACIQRVHGNDQEPEAGGALIDVQTLLSQTETTHVCLFHSPKETGPVGINAIRGHGSAGGAVSGCISMHFLEKKDPQTGKWVADKENPHRRMVFEGRGPYIDLLIRGDWENGTFNVLGNFQQKLGELTADDRKASTIDELTQGQRETLEFLAGACGIWKDPNGATAQQVAACRVQHLNREPTPSEVESTRRQLNALVKEQLASQTKKGQTFKYTIRS